MKRRTASAWLAAAVLALAGPSAAQPNGVAAACGAGLADAQRLEGPGFTVAFAPRPAPWALGRHFAIEMVICPKGGVPLPDSVRVDARMPEHGHGMNYRPSVVAQGTGRWRAEGLLLHMAGRWELVFELRSSGQVERLTQDLQLR